MRRPDDVATPRMRRPGGARVPRHRPAAWRGHPSHRDDGPGRRPHHVASRACRSVRPAGPKRWMMDPLRHRAALASGGRYAGCCRQRPAAPAGTGLPAPASRPPAARGPNAPEGCSAGQHPARPYPQAAAPRSGEPRPPEGRRGLVRHRSVDGDPTTASTSGYFPTAGCGMSNRRLSGSTMNVGGLLGGFMPSSVAWPARVPGASF